jgi:hypothetical protein
VVLFIQYVEKYCVYSQRREQLRMNCTDFGQNYPQAGAKQQDILCVAACQDIFSILLVVLQY